MAYATHHASDASALLEGSAWSGAVSYALASTVGGGHYAGTHVVAPPPGFAEAVARVFAEVARFTNLEVTRTAASKSDVVVHVADTLAYAASTMPLGGYAFFPGEAPEAGDVWLGTNRAGDVVLGRLGYRTLMHEIGHALGLKHPHEHGDGGQLGSAHDGAEWSVMSSRSHGGGDIGLGVETSGHSETFMTLDIAALQSLYGANYSDRGDDVYTFDPAQRVMLRAVWDGGGNDTYDFSQYTNGLVIDLTPGRWSTTGQEPHLNRAQTLSSGEAPVYASGSVHNAHLVDGNWRSAIENARGGSGDDTITGSAVRNRLDGGAGDDVLDGGAGADRLVGGEGADTLFGGDGNDWLRGGASDDELFGGDGRDTIVGDRGDDVLEGGDGVDLLSGGRGADLLTDDGVTADTLNGGRGRDTIIGGAGDDRLMGGGGSDSLFGGDGADRIVGGRGVDTLTGGAGADTFVVFGRGAGDTITDFTPGEDKLDVTDPGAALRSAAQVGADTVMVIGRSKLTLADVAIAELSEVDVF
ncbi:M10 family metallopeptidase [Acuticoccus sp.]|uniref:M10 family metallopeptidase n=1 Tax=Acuticoccus sp. TaxID=1904378 RepID=UPI003B52CF76